MTPRQQSRSGTWLIRVLVCIVLLALVWLLATNQSTARRSDTYSKVVIALPLQLSSGALWVAQDRQFFNKHGLDVTIHTFQLGKLAWESVMQGKADLAVMGDTPFMLAAMRGEKIAMLTSVFASRNAMAIIARKDRGIGNAHDLAGKTVGTLFGTNAEYFLDKMLLLHNIKKTSVTVVNLKPDQIAAALRSGEVDAVTLWQPALAKLERELGQRALSIYGEDIFVFRFVLAGTQDYIASHPEQVRQVVAALADGVRYMLEQPVPARRIVGRVFGIAPDLLSGAFEPGDFTLELNQTLLLALDEQTRWAMKQGLVRTGPVPNYLEFIRPEALDAVLPSSNRIIR